MYDVQLEFRHREVGRLAMDQLNSILEERSGDKRVILEGPVVEVLIK